MDATDLEASLRDAWDYEDVKGSHIFRPGLGSKDPRQQDAPGNVIKLSSEDD